MSGVPVGFDEMRKYPLFEALFKRRSRRISLGVRSVPAGSNSYTSNADPQPLTALEEAVLIAAVGMTGVTLPEPAERRGVVPKWHRALHRPTFESGFG